MLHLTPLEQTVAVRQLMKRSLAQGLEQGLTKGVKQGLTQGVKQGLARGVKQGLVRGLTKGVKQGREEGELIGKIQFAQRLLKRPLTPKSQLFQRSRSELKQLLKQLEAQF